MSRLFARWSEWVGHGLTRWRYLKFGLVGASGTLVNLGVLFLCQEVVLQGIDATQRLYASLALAIGLATVNNFAWNRRWTWQDRLAHAPDPVWRQFARYVLASWLGTGVQYVLTLWLATHMHYLPANVIAIGVASFVNYFANDWWTFQAQPRIVAFAELRARYERVTLILLLLAAGVYAFDLGGENIPRNGDELVYAHIAFKTWLHAQHSGAWLPLVSDLGPMRNTKPPVLFWQAMSVGWLGLPWQLFWLRLPSLLYTFATTVGVVWVARHIAQRHAASTPQGVLSPRSIGAMAGLFFLACFSTYRYGRPYLTSAIETFWLSVPVWLVFWRGAVGAHRAGASPPPLATRGVWVGTALSMGAVALTKSFVLIVPLAGSVWLSLCWLQPAQWRRWLVGTTLSAMVGLACFGLWFVLDPDPQSVWREFVIGENLGKMNQGGPSYWRTAWVGGFSVWWQALALPQNALLLAPAVAVLLVRGLAGLPAAWRAPHREVTAVLWIHMAVLTVFFMLPSQRSSRYVIPLMPMVAVLCVTQLHTWSLTWHRLCLGLSTLLCALGLGLLGLFLWAGWRVDLYPLWGRMGLMLLLVLQILALLRLVASLWRSFADDAADRLHTSWVWLLGWVISLYAWFGLLSAPLHTAANQYRATSQQQMAGLRLAVPSYFNGDFERWRFLLPQAAHLSPYPAASVQQDAAIRTLLQSHDAVIVHRGWFEPPPDCGAIGCEVVQQRIALRGRHKPGEITLAGLHTPESLLFWRETLVKRPP